jgi:hypothetical protein
VKEEIKIMELIVPNRSRVMKAFRQRRARKRNALKALYRQGKITKAELRERRAELYATLCPPPKFGETRKPLVPQVPGGGGNGNGGLPML